MLDVGPAELLVIIVVALLVVGPKDLPRVVRGFARAIARMRRMADEFMGTVNDYVRESELQELREAVEKTRRAMHGQGNFDDLLDPTGTSTPVVVNDPKIAPTDGTQTDETQVAVVGETPAEPAEPEPAPAVKPEGQGTP